MVITSWNVNGLRSTIKNGFDSLFYDKEHAVICLQEVKMAKELLNQSMFEPKKSYWNEAVKPGYSGVTTIVNDDIEVLSISSGIGDSELDDEGRVISLEFESFILINTYAPHSNRKLTRLDEKERFISKFNDFIKNMRSAGKPLIIVGDLNVAHKEIDLFNYKTNKKNAGFLPQERAWLDELISLGFVDAFRYLNSDQVVYSWWGFAHKLRERNIGWRIDYILVDEAIKDKIIECYYSTEQLGSDHCPVTIKLDLF